MGKSKLPLTETVYYILLSLIEPGHGYKIMQDIERLSQGQVRMAAGTMYGAIENLLKQKYICLVTSDDSRRKVYRITTEGMDILKQQMKRYQHMVSITEEILEG